MLCKALAILACLSSAAFAESPTETIPLKDIWAWDMPGTKNVRDLEPEVFGPDLSSQPIDVQQKRNRGSLVLQIHEHLSTLDDAGFAVAGNARDALKDIYSVLIEQKKTAASFSPSSDITLFFFSHMCAAYVRVDHVERKRNTIEIFYRYVPHSGKELTWHFALIPVGQLPPGNYQVTMTQLPVDMSLMHETTSEVDKKIGNKFVCKPFSFSISDH